MQCHRVVFQSNSGVERLLAVGQLATRPPSPVSKRTLPYSRQIVPQNTVGWAERTYSAWELGSGYCAFETLADNVVAGVMVMSSSAHYSTCTEVASQPVLGNREQSMGR
jgi:hypothetical protein